MAWRRGLVGCLLAQSLHQVALADEASDETCPASDPDCSKNKDPDYGAGCRHISREMEFRERMTIVNWRRIDSDPLMDNSKIFVCYNGNLTAMAEPEPRRVWKDKSFADATVVVIEDFLDPEELAHLKKLTLEHTEPLSTDPTLKSRLVAGGQFPPDIENLGVYLPEDELVSDVEHRIGTMLGIQEHKDEFQLQLSISTDGAAAGVKSKRGRIHHDKDVGLKRLATVIVYLEAPEEGGELVFPALPFNPKGPVARTPEMKELATEMKRIVETTVNTLKENTADPVWPHLAIGEDSPFYEKASGICPADGKVPVSADGTTPLIIKPKVGRAVIFWHETAKAGRAIFDTFHYSCPVKKGQKMAVQKFKNEHEYACHSSVICAIGETRGKRYGYPTKQGTDQP